MVNETEEENDQEDQCIVEAEVGQVLGESGRGVGDAGGDAQCGGVQEFTPWPARGHHRFADFREAGHKPGGHFFLPKNHRFCWGRRRVRLEKPC